MKKSFLKRLGLTLALLTMLALPELASAQYFNYNANGDVLAGFRKTGANAGSYEMVVDFGSVTNFLQVSMGSTINMTNYAPAQLTSAFSSGYGNLQWSVFAAAQSATSPWVTPLGSFPKDTIWYTLPGTNLNTQTQLPLRFAYTTQQNQKQLMNSVGNGANFISSSLGTNANNNTLLVVEPITYSQNILTASIGDSVNTAIGDFGASGAPLSTTVENLTPNSFTAAQRSDFYQVCPYNYADPITGLTNRTSYFVGYFILNPNGTMTFTRASAVSVPSVGAITSTVTNGFAPLTVVFTNTVSGSITNWVWNFGNGTVITNATGANVTNSYAVGGNFTVTLTVYGPGGSNSLTLTNFIVASPTPSINVKLSAGQFVLYGTNCPAGVQYRILNSTNVALPLASWQAVVTNTFLSNSSFSYTNSTTNAAGFFRLVSP